MIMEGGPESPGAIPKVASRPSCQRRGVKALTTRRIQPSAKVPDARDEGWGGRM